MAAGAQEGETGTGEDISERLALGTVQLGMPYGILGSTPPPELQVAQLLEVAWDEGVRYYDTGQAYGKSEELLGTFLPPGGRFGTPRIITKLHPDAWRDNAREIERRLEDSRARLGARDFWAVLLHRDRMLEQWDGDVGDVLRRWRKQGRIRHLGISLEAIEALPGALAVDDMEVVQLPASVFDHRVLDSGLHERARRAGKRILVRSVYFQGMAVADIDRVRARAPAAAAMVGAYAEFCERHGLDRRRFAVGYVRRRLPGAILVIGAETTEQARENCRIIAGPPASATLCDAWDEAWQSPDDRVIDLRRLGAQLSAPHA
jgi:aryl-alcohol dehydrogenase-like predicted oxidoreductase